MRCARSRPAPPDAAASTRGGAASRRAFLHLAGLATAGATLAFAGCGPRTPLRIAAHPWPGYEFLRLAQRFGWVAPERVQLATTAGFAESIAHIEQGRADGACLTLDEVLRLREGGVPLACVLVCNVSAGADVVLAKPEVARLADLRGRRIGTPDGTLGALMLVKLLAAAELGREDVEVVRLPDDHAAAWQSSALDAIVTYEPWTSRLQREAQLVDLFDSRSLPNLIVDVLAVRADVAAIHARALRELIAGHFRALARWRTNPVDTSYRLAPLLDVEPGEVTRVYRGLDLPDLLYNREYLRPPTEALGAAAAEIARVMRELGLLQRPLETAGLFVADYLPEDGA